MIYPCTYTEGQKQKSLPPTGFEPAIPASERLQTHALDRAATEIGLCLISTDDYILYINKRSSPKNFISFLCPKKYNCNLQEFREKSDLVSWRSHIQQEFEDYWSNVLKTHLVSTFNQILLKFCDTISNYDFNIRSFIEGQDESKIEIFHEFNESVPHLSKKKHILTIDYRSDRRTSV
jgi:hypothetical protein